MSFGSRLTEALDAAGISQAELARRVGLKSSAVSNYVNGHREPDLEMLKCISAALNLSTDFLLSVEPNKKKDIFTNDAIVEKLRRTIMGDFDFSANDFEDDFAAIPLRETQASAGSGMSDQGIDVVGTLAFRRTWLTRMGMTAVRSSLIRVRGDSMSPHLHDGDVILVDQGARDIINRSVYVLRIGAELFVKRLYRVDAQIIAASDNPAYQPFALDPDQDDQAVEGRVRWSARELPCP